MGSTGRNFRCPLCGYRHPDSTGYALDIVGYPLNDCCLEKVLKDASPCSIKVQQLMGVMSIRIIMGDHGGPQGCEGILTITCHEGIFKQIACFLLPDKDITHDFLQFGLNAEVPSTLERRLAEVNDPKHNRR